MVLGGWLQVRGPGVLLEEGICYDQCVLLAKFCLPLNCFKSPLLCLRSVKPELATDLMVCVMLAALMSMPVCVFWIDMVMVLSSFLNGLCHTLCDPGLPHAEPLPLRPATADRCLRRRHSGTQRHCSPWARKELDMTE